MTKFVNNFSLYEHQKVEVSEKIKNDLIQNSTLYKIEKNTLSASYFIGMDWLIENHTSLYVEPKLNKSSNQTNYLKMLFDALKHPEVLEHTKDLFEIKFDEPTIEINQKQDLLTPLLVVHFLSLVQQIVKKGLKKSYYKVEKNLTAKVKGKILVNQTIKKNIAKNDMLKTYCSYDEFGFNGLENRLLKKALLFVQRYLPTIPHIDANNSFITNTLHYISPAFESVSEEIELHEIKHSKFNAFYKEYTEAIRLAKIILKRFGYNIHNITKNEKDKIKTPPFWIDMAKLFELYVLGLLKDRFGKDIEYHWTNKYGSNELDFLLKSQDYKMVIDAKYKTIYENYFVKEDMRQVSGYARLRQVYEALKIPKPFTQIIPCLIVYPLQTNGIENFANCNLYGISINEYVEFYKIGVKLPVIL